jgi:hypothetical protein
MARSRKPARRPGKARGSLTALLVVVLIAAAGYVFRGRLIELYPPPERADLARLHAAVDSACASLDTRKSSSASVDLGNREIRQDRLELPRRSSLLRANLIVTRAVERAGGTVSYGIESVDEKRRWQTVTLGVTDGDSLVREVRLEKRLR